MENEAGASRRDGRGGPSKCWRTKTALTTATLYRRATMAALEAITIPFELPRDEAAALSQFVKRVDYETCVRFASKFVFYNGRAEADTMWTAVRMVQGQLAEAGFAPR